MYNRNGYEPEQCSSREATYSYGENEGQMKLEETKSNLQLENTRLKNKLAKQERRVIKSKQCLKKRESCVEIPNDLRAKYILIF